MLDLGLGGGSHIGGNDNDLVDLGLLNHNNVTGNDNDVLDLGLFNNSNVTGKDNDLIDLGLGGSQQTGGTDNDFIDLSLNDTNEAAGGSHDFLGLDLDLMHDSNLAGVNLDLGNFDVAELSLNEQGASLDLNLGIVDVHADTGNLLDPGHCEGLLTDDLNVDLGLHDVLNTGLGQGDNGLLDTLGLNNDTSHLAANHGGGTVLGLQLGLGAWV